VLVASIRPVVYLLKKVDAGVREADAILLFVLLVLFVTRIERRFSSGWQEVEQAICL
jgi:hypothetical protein